MIYNLVNWYVKRFRFPFRGLKYFMAFLNKTGNQLKKYQKKIHNGGFINVSPAEHIERQIFWYGYYERKFILTWESFIREKDIILDIGANIGYYSLVASFRNPDGFVYAFEPYSVKYQELVQNISLNNVNHIIPLPYAVSNEAGVQTFFISNQDNYGMTGLRLPENYSGRNEMVNSVIMDQWFEENRISSVQMIKMDIEGAEYDALCGMKQVLEKHQPVLFVEINAALLNRFGRSPGDIYQLLKGFNYVSYAVVSENKLKEIDNEDEDELIVFIPAGYQLPHSIRMNHGPA